MSCRSSSSLSATTVLGTDKVKVLFSSNTGLTFSNKLIKIRLPLFLISLVNSCQAVSKSTVSIVFKTGSFSSVVLISVLFSVGVTGAEGCVLKFLREGILLLSYAGLTSLAASEGSVFLITGGVFSFLA
jgi:hypothetical protein